MKSSEDKSNEPKFSKLQCALLEQIKTRYGLVYLALREVGIKSGTLRQWLSSDDKFKAAFYDAERRGFDLRLETVTAKAIETMRSDPKSLRKTLKDRFGESAPALLLSGKATLKWVENNMVLVETNE